MTERTTHVIRNISLDLRLVVRRSPRIEHEQKVAMVDLLEENYFAPLNKEWPGPYDVVLGVENNRLIFTIKPYDAGGKQDEDAYGDISLSVRSMHRVIKDYFLICESYFDAIKTKAPSQIEPIDMARRGVHNEGAEILRARLSEQVHMDMNTARRLFTLICVLHVRG